ncbi:MAG TPA: hypothetical protein VK101_01535 [Limnochordia bacterium]|nr:hypothetical protein [Limnochordia bacterium]
MGWLVASAFFFTLVLAAATLLLWRRLRRLEASAAGRPGLKVRPEGEIFHSVELSLEAMLEELELKEREILQRLDRREREILASFERLYANLPLQSSEVPGQALHSEPSEVEREEAEIRDKGADQCSPPSEESPSAGEAGEAFRHLRHADKVAAVRRLAREGLDAVAIAKQLGLGQGEVALILHLERTV